MCCDNCCRDHDRGYPEGGSPSGGKNGKNTGGPPTPPEDLMPPTDSEIENGQDVPESVKKLFPPEFKLKLLNGVLYVKNNDGGYTRLGTYTEGKGFHPEKGIPPHYLGLTRADAKTQRDFPDVNGSVYIGPDGHLWALKADGSWVYLGQKNEKDGTIKRSSAPEAKGQPSNKDIANASDVSDDVKNLFPPGYKLKILDGVIYASDGAGGWVRMGTYSDAKGFQPDKNLPPSFLGFKRGGDPEDLKIEFPHAKGELYIGPGGYIWLQRPDGSWVHLGRVNPDGSITRQDIPEARW